MVIATEDKVPIDGLLSKTGARGIEPVGQDSHYLGDIVQSLLAIWTGGDRNRPATWGLAMAPLTIR